MPDSHAAIGGAGLRPWWMRADGRARRRCSARARQTFSDQGKLARSVPPACARQCEPCHIRFPASALSMMRAHSGHRGYGKCRRGGWHIGGSDSSSRDDFSRNFQPAACAALITIRDQCMRQCGTRSASRWPQAIFAGTGFPQHFCFDGIETGLRIPDVAGFLDANRL